MFVQAVLSGVLACGLVSSAALPSRLGSRHALSPFARRQVVAQIATYPAGKDCQGEAMDIMYVNPGQSLSCPRLPSPLTGIA